MNKAALPDLAPLFEPIKLKDKVLPNRFVMPSMSRGWCVNGCPPQAMADYYRRRVQGGVHLIIGEGCVVNHPSSSGNPSFARLRLDTIAGWAACAEAVHDAGGIILFQLTHEGALRIEKPNDPNPTLSASGMVTASRRNGRAATIAELNEIRDAFVSAALCAQQAGADGIELHGCHGFFIDQFLWHETNQRDDIYGGNDIRARLRYPAELVRAIRAATGPDFLICFRFSQWKEPDYEAKIFQGPQELGTFLEELKAAGIDLFHVSARRFWEPEWPGSDLGLAGWAKSLTNVPVIAVGSVGLDMDVMETLVGDSEARSTGSSGLTALAQRFRNGEFDLVAVGRSLIGDPDWVLKVRALNFADIRIFTKQYVLAGLSWETEANASLHQQT